MEDNLENAILKEMITNKAVNDKNKTAKSGLF